MLKKDILPAVTRFELSLKKSLEKDKALGLSDANSYEYATLRSVKENKKTVFTMIKRIEQLMEERPDTPEERSCFYHDQILPLMEDLSKKTDALEKITDRSLWPMPAYSDLLFGKD
jgi:glutamine synthetase